jgi:hypothetical protein
MIILNLVSDDLKKEIKRRKLYSMFTGLLYFLIFIVVFFSMLIYYTGKLIEIKMNNIVNQRNIINSNSQVLNQKISKINTLIDFTDYVQKDYIPWTCFMDQIFTNNKNIQFNSLSINKKALTFMIRGSSKTRDDLLGYKKQLEANGLFKEVTLPFNSLLSKENINFEITAKINPEKLSKLF